MMLVWDHTTNICMVLNILTRYPLTLIILPYVLYGVKYIGLVSLAAWRTTWPVQSQIINHHRCEARLRFQRTNIPPTTGMQLAYGFNESTCRVTHIP